MKKNEITEVIQAHSRFSPSSSHSWIYCHGMPTAIDGLDDDGNDAAELGTAAHTLLEHCIKTDTDPLKFLGRKIRVESRTLGEDTIIYVDEEMVDGVQFVLDNLADFPGTIHSELRVNLSAWLPGQFGTLDLGGVCEDYITIEDFKFGMVEVDVIENTQLMLYALGFWYRYVRLQNPHIRDVRLRIHQPRLYRGERMKEWWTTVDDLLEFGKIATAAYESACRPNAPRTPGKSQCRYCRAAGTNRCPEFMDWMLDIVGLRMEDLDSREGITMPDINSMTPERRAYLLSHMSVFDKFFDNLRKQAEDDWNAGLNVPEFKMVEGRSRREWVEEKDAVNFLLTYFDEDFIFDRKLISPAKAEALGGKKVKQVIGEVIRRKPGKPQLVSIKDQRPEMVRVTELFDVIDEEDELFT